eukprot:GILI01002442.1.p2 GENE.GILI01002442.1~~GILI01002442.1.p2  ORF type:complete len:249 (+),score=78.60 GILI01002442.1:67-747(+)
MSEEDQKTNVEGAEGDDVQMFDFSMKKKKKKSSKKDKEPSSEVPAEGASAAESSSSSSVSGPSGEFAYSYDQLLARVYDSLRSNNPALAEKKKYVMKPPQVTRLGTKKSVWVNFQEICNLMHRNPEHVYQFILAELGTEGSIAGAQQLILKGKYNGTNIEKLLRKYIVEYVTCHMCKNPDTSLSRDAVSRLYFMHCDSCNSARSVAPIKAGYHAMAKGERQKLKNQ